MRRQFKGYLFALVALATVVVAILGAGFASANEHSQKTAHTSISGSGQKATAKMVAMHTIDMQKVAAETSAPASHRSAALPLLTGVSSVVYSQRKADAAHNQTAPVSSSRSYAAPTTQSALTPTRTKAFQGMADSASTCPYFGGCEPPDQALATSKYYVLQGVNTSFAVYNTSGTLQAGWPKNSQSFFGVPNPGACDSAGPFLSDPRAFYDANDGRFWVAMLQVEGAFGLNSCPFKTLYWVAVSKTSDPRGVWNVYAFDMSLSTTNAADYTQFGFDQQAIYFSGNMFNQAGTAYQYAEIFGANKSSMENGLGVSAFGFSGLFVSSSRSVLVDTVQPVEAQLASKYDGPRGGLFINSWNINGDPFGDNCFSSVCHGLSIWTLTNPGASTTGLTFAFTDSLGYVLPPAADQPGCSQCIETLDTRISGTPAYRNGLISFALETGVNNGSQVVPGILWGQVAPEMNDGGTLTGAVLFQRGYYFYSGDGAASFGALMPDADGNLFMVFEFMNRSINPEIAYTARRVAFPFGNFHDGGIVLKSGSAPTFDSRWGDFEATSFDGATNVWFSGQYSASSGDWSTFIGRDNFCATCN
jgi:hypothetical protein